MPDDIADSSTFREVAIRLEGKIDALSAKLDGRLDAVMAKIEAGDRESMQLFKLQESELGHVTETVRTNTARIAAIANEAERRDQAIEHDLQDVKNELADFTTVRKIVYGMVALILVAVVTALLAAVVIRP